MVGDLVKVDANNGVTKAEPYAPDLGLKVQYSPAMPKDAVLIGRLEEFDHSNPNIVKVRFIR